MNSVLTSYAGLFERIRSIEIPLIQRDYAQGRESDAVKRIRGAFLDVLHRAVAGEEPVSLDFVYGNVDAGVFHPLDGQQRLTTLFLLHWYIASRADQLSPEHGWKSFSYATRPSARLFCERLVKSRLPADCAQVSAWLVDQPWFLSTWNHDPTIRSMLVMLDDIDERFRGDDFAADWARLMDVAAPVIGFHHLGVEALGLADDLYIKMNSRGKPLTPFETFKARFEQMLEPWLDAATMTDVAHKLDGKWADAFWAYRGDDNVIDDEMMRYFHFVIEVLEWRTGLVSDGDLEDRAEALFGSASPTRQQNTAFLVSALDAWIDVDIPKVFGDLFTKADGVFRTKVLLFGREGRNEIDLFGACVNGAGVWNGKKRVFPLPEMLLFYGVLLHRIEQTSDAVRRLRTLRNLVEASSNELRPERMNVLLTDVRTIVVDGTLEGVSGFNTAQNAEERKKRELVAKVPANEGTIIDLENDPILRGALAVFDLDADTAVFERRAKAFRRMFSDASCWVALTGALLAMGDYSRQGRYAFQLGSVFNEAPWRELFTAPAMRSPLEKTRMTLGALLDAVADTPGDLTTELEAIRTSWLAKQTSFDWRWYLARYAPMREGRSGIYCSSTTSLGFDLCMLEKTRMSSWYRDPYLSAIRLESGVSDAVEDPWFMSNQPKWMRLKKSGVELSCVDDGILLRRPGAAHATAFDEVCSKHGIGRDLLLKVPQREIDGRRVDTEDRIQTAAKLVSDLVGREL